MLKLLVIVFLSIQLKICLGQATRYAKVMRANATESPDTSNENSLMQNSTDVDSVVKKVNYIVDNLLTIKHTAGETLVKNLNLDSKRKLCQLLMPHCEPPRNTSQNSTDGEPPRNSSFVKNHSTDLTINFMMSLALPIAIVNVYRVLDWK